MAKKNQTPGAFFNKPEVSAYIFLLPSLLILSVFTVIPLLASFAISMLNMNIFLKNITFAGLDNFSKLLSDEHFWNSMLNTFYFTVLEMPLQIIFSVLIAVFLQKNTTFRKFLRSVLFIPFVCSMTAVSIVWSMMLNPSMGIVPYFLGIIGLPGIEFLKSPTLAMPTVVFITVWKNFGFSMIILVAGMQSISSSYYEAAEIDGASKWNQFINVTLPLIVPTLSFCIITNTIDSLKVFDQIYVMTQGGPLYKTETIVQRIYATGFQLSPFNLGYASAIAEVLFVMIAIITLFMNKYFQTKETVDE